MSEFTREGLERADRLLREGQEFVGENALILAARGGLEFQWVNGGFAAHDREESERRLRGARVWIDRALELDPELPAAHVTLGWFLLNQAGIREAERHFEFALQHEPNNVMGMTLSAMVDWMSGRRDALHQRVQRFRAIDPWDYWGLVVAGVDASWRGETTERDDFFARALTASDASMGLLIIGLVLAQDGDLDQARASWARGANGGSDLGDALCVVLTRALAGDAEPARAFFGTWLTSPTMYGDVQWLWITADAMTLAGCPDEALTALERAVAVGFDNLWMLEGRDPLLAPLHGHPRYLALLETVRRQLAS